MQKHKLIIMRHAKSDWATHASGDFERPLAERGKKDAPRMGLWLAQQVFIPEIIISSPALRAKQTTMAVADKIDMPVERLNWESGIYAASLDDLLSVLDEYSYQANTLLLVGHNPGLDYLLEYLSKTQPDYNQSGKLMTTAAVAVLDFGDNKISTRINSAKLELLIRPKELN